VFVIAAVLFVDVAYGRNGLTCKDENGRTVDWWVIMKAPYEPSSSDPNVASGFGYAYADANSPSLQLTSNRLDTNLQGALGSTLAQIYSADSSNTAWFMYNDEPPKDKVSSIYGHTKGDAAFNSGGGFWLIHSVPRFPADPSSQYSYPDNEKEYGQSFLCMTLDLDTMNTVAQAFLLNRPYVYSSNMPSSLINSVPYMAQVAQKQWIVNPATSNVSTINTVKGYSFTVFSRNAAWDQNLYSALVAPTVGANLLVESWMNGADSNKMPTFCAGTNGLKYSVINIREVGLGSSVTWLETQDHSKWAISTNSRRPVFCIGDTNRQYSQAKRGGGTACASNTSIWKSLNAMVSKADSC
jgi:deoxyribonuclease-2